MKQFLDAVERVLTRYPEAVMLGLVITAFVVYILFLVSMGMHFSHSR